MSAPRPLGLMGATLLFWGWRTGYFWIGAVLAVLAELPGLFGLRYTLADRDFNRLSDLAAILTASIGVYYFLSPGEEHLARVYLALLPAGLFPLLAGQLWSGRPTLSLSAILYTYRRMQRKRPDLEVPEIDAYWPFMGLLLFSAAGAGERSPWFYVFAAGLVLWGLWWHRRGRMRTGAFAMAVVLALGLGGAAQWGVHEVQDRVYGWMRDWWSDPFQTTTSMGEMGRLKLSHEIAFRVEPDQGGGGSMLLRETAYDLYTNRTWYATDADFHILIGHFDYDEGWFINRSITPTRMLTVYMDFQGRRAMVPMPQGASWVNRLPVRSLERNRLGAIKAQRPPGWAAYQVHYDPDESDPAGPTSTDLSLPRDERELLMRRAQELGLDASRPNESVMRLLPYFWNEYRYSLVQEQVEEGLTPLAAFLTDTKTGHCEHFATATVLLLRAAGIPARYVTGWSVGEWDADAGVWVVRYSHRHAWAEVWVHGGWVPLDTTPPDWTSAEAAQRPALQGLRDWLSGVSNAVQRWRWLEAEEDVKTAAKWLIAPLAVFVALRLGLGRGAKLIRRRRRRARRVVSWRGEDSPFYRVERRLEREGHRRGPGESMGAWVRSVADGELAGALRLHYRYRFDPEPFGDEEYAELERLVEDWLQRRRDVSA